MNWIDAHRKPIRILKTSRRSGARRFVVNSSTVAGRSYVVVNKKGKWSCSCRGWIFPRKVVLKNGTVIRVRKNCRHIVRLAHARQLGSARKVAA